MSEEELYTCRRCPHGGFGPPVDRKHHGSSTQHIGGSGGADWASWHWRCLSHPARSPLGLANQFSCSPVSSARPHGLVCRRTTKRASSQHQQLSEGRREGQEYSDFRQRFISDRDNCCVRLGFIICVHVAQRGALARPIEELRHGEPPEGGGNRSLTHGPRWHASSPARLCSRVCSCPTWRLCGNGPRMQPAVTVARTAVAPLALQRAKVRIRQSGA